MLPPTLTVLLLLRASAIFRALQISQVEMESAVAGTLDTFRSTLQVALDRAKATAGEVT